MAKGYWVAFADVTDPEAYKATIAENAKAFRTYGGRFLVRGGATEAVEGRPRSRVVVIEFPTYAAALECYRSPEYAKAMALRARKAVMDLAITEGYGGRSRRAVDFTAKAMTCSVQFWVTCTAQKPIKTGRKVCG